MLFTREIDYAVRTVRALSQADKLNVHQICQAEHIPPAFGYHILKKLEQGGILTILRGSNGGYRLTADPEKLTLMDIVLAIDPAFFLNECLRREYHCPNNPRQSPCQIHTELCRVQAVLESELRRNSIASLWGNSPKTCAQSPEESNS